MMKKILLLFCLLPFINSFSQEIFLSKNIIRINNPSYVDSVTIYNKGKKVLRISTIKYRKTKYAYNIDPHGEQAMWKLLDEYGKGGDVIKIIPKRSITIRFKLAASLRKESYVMYDKVDQIFFYNNSINAPVEILKVVNVVGDGRKGSR